MHLMGASCPRVYKIYCHSITFNKVSIKETLPLYLLVCYFHTSALWCSNLWTAHCFNMLLRHIWSDDQLFSINGHIKWHKGTAAFTLVFESKTQPCRAKHACCLCCIFFTYSSTNSSFPVILTQYEINIFKLPISTIQKQWLSWYNTINSQLDATIINFYW